MKRPAPPEEIAPAYVFLASAQCSSDPSASPARRRLLVLFARPLPRRRGRIHRAGLVGANAAGGSTARGDDARREDRIHPRRHRGCRELPGPGGVPAGGAAPRSPAAAAGRRTARSAHAAGVNRVAGDPGAGGDLQPCRCRCQRGRDRPRRARPRRRRGARALHQPLPRSGLQPQLQHLWRGSACSPARSARRWCAASRARA